MSVRPTSIAAYQHLDSTGTLSKQAGVILDFLNETGFPYSLREIQKHTGIDINAVSGRVNALKNGGFVVETEQRKCSITKRTVTPVRIRLRRVK